MKLFSGKNIITALKALGVMFVIELLCLFIGTASLSGNAILGWTLFGGFLFIFYFAAYMDGIIRGQSEAKTAAMLENQRAKTGNPLTEEEEASCFSVKKGMAVSLMLALPALILAVASLITGDNVIWLRVVTRLYHTPYMKLFYDGLSSQMAILMYFVFSVLYPAVYFIGYLRGPASFNKIKEIIKKNDEDYKNGVRRKRPVKKKKRGFFW